MMPLQAPRLDDRDAAAVLEALLRRLPAYVPGWRPQSSGPSQALLQIVARYMEVVIERLNGTPEKNLLAFLDLLGLSLVEAQAARAPIVFKFTPPALPPLPLAAAPAAGTPSGAAALAALNLPQSPKPLGLPPISIRVPAGTQVAATSPGGGAPLVFETEQAFGLTGAQLAQVVTLWPGQDIYSDHTATLAANTPFTLFRSTQLTPHMLYLAHDGYFALSGQATVEIEFDLLTPSSVPLSIAWEYWDGQGWHSFGDPDIKPSSKPSPIQGQSGLPTSSTPPEVEDGTNGLTRSGVIVLRGDCINTAKTTIDGINAYWLRGRITEPLPPDLSRQDALLRRIRISTVIDQLSDIQTSDELLKKGAQPDQAFADTSSLDVSKAFYPFGQAPQPGSAFSFSSKEIFSKPNALVNVGIDTAKGPLGDPVAGDTPPVFSWEYWDGGQWTALSLIPSPQAGNTADFTSESTFSFTVPDQAIPQSKLNGKDGHWVRVRIINGGYFKARSIPIPNGDPVKIMENHPPLLADIRLAYLYRAPRAFPEHCLTYNDFGYEDHTSDLRWPGAGFASFHAVADATPALYLGFDKALPADLVSMYLNIQEQPGQLSNPPLVWEYWDGETWQEVAVQDDTDRLIHPGMLAFIGPADSTVLARFGSPLYWLRGRLREDGQPTPATINGLFLNATWAIQAQAARNEILGAGTGEPGQAFFFAHNPVLDGEAIEVRELEGLRAAVELPILAREVASADLNVVYSANRAVQEVWVRWHRQPDLYQSKPADRHYILERSGGRIIFGDEVNGRLLPAGKDNVIARMYQWGGGAGGNVAAGAISQLLGGIPYVSGVTNPHAAEGGADGETIAEVRLRGPQVLRHRERALSARDYESLAHEASPGVAIARALPATHPSGRPAPGWVKLIIVPHSQAPQPQPSFGLRSLVEAFLRARAPASLTGIFVTGPTYLEVGVTATIVPLDLSQAGPVAVAARQALEAFFHPLTGGPSGRGWPFGRGVYLADAAALLEAQPGVDYVQELELLLDGIPQGEQVSVPPDRIVVAGQMRIRVRAREQSGGNHAITPA